MKITDKTKDMPQQIKEIIVSLGYIVKREQSSILDNTVRLNIQADRQIKHKETELKLLIREKLKLENEIAICCYKYETGYLNNLIYISLQ